ncbi:YihY/virulence factor BrkB family protein [Marinifilum caeruleilacunae]|uniref:YihY/virulence factor BrkB family protein n=1 Tax=Marinifilum caeruleilacunae TaxID=2499076 RepID=A0ABX1WU16_9BACT|nr:YihY/virulence factor BrkB family protein [Marinifilum caeruleilacunae]NOU59497.1 YihY/virulence factor BrkB family protein [Marinifilum caeruleilacunae]
MIRFIKEVFNHFLESNTFQKGAALAYYAVFSLLPMIVILISVLGLFFGEQAVSGEIYAQLKDVLGKDASIQIQNLIKNQHVNHNNILTTCIGFATLALSASGMFTQVHNAFNDIWNLKSKPKSSILNYIRMHFASFTILIGLFFLILISLSINGFLVNHASNLQQSYRFLYLYEHLVSVVVFSIVFAIMFQFLGDSKIHWKAVALGGLFTSLLFTFGKAGIGLYISHSHISTTFGSASAIAILMLWVYYTSQILFLGASFVSVVSSRLGYEIKANSNAISIKHVELED